MKGSAYVVQAIEELQKTIDFDFQLITGMSHEEAMDTCRRADIIIDQLLIGSYGVFALESMLMGKPVLDYLRADLQDQYPSCPIVSVNKDTIQDELKDLLQSPGGGSNWASRVASMPRRITTIETSHGCSNTFTALGKGRARRSRPLPPWSVCTLVRAERNAKPGALGKRRRATGIPSCLADIAPSFVWV